ncbi:MULTISPECIES: phage antirepressor KilAC domain-containing protein [unclassified Pseudomonas]|uniref:phage antirepressor KilAC domain-containing protein n=1 Tax=unclassified Pseudomonas TaxID=196821 RepID=UPI003158DA3A
MHNQITPGNTCQVATHFRQEQNVSRHTMSSREISELTGKRHDNVKRTIDTLAADRVINFPQIEENPATVGRPGKHYLIGKRDSFVVVAQLSPEFTARLVDRWQELEEQAAPRIPANYAEALQLAADQARENTRLLGVIELQAPKVAAIRRLAAAEGAICITDAAKHLGIPPSKLFDWMQANRWIYRRGGSSRWVAAEPRIRSGYMKHKVTALKPDTETGIERAAFQALVTPKGLTRLAELLQEAA